MNGTLSLWIIRGLLGLFFALVIFMGNRLYKTDDDFDVRLRAVEQAVVRIPLMAEDIKDMGKDVKTLLHRGQ